MKYTTEVQKFIEGIWFSHPASAVDSRAVRTLIWRDWIDDLVRRRVKERLSTRVCYQLIDHAHKRWVKEDK